MLTFAVAAPLVAAGVMATVDYSTLHRAQSETQSVADTAALMAAKELVLIQTDKSKVTTVALAYVDANLQPTDADVTKPVRTAQVSTDYMSVEVSIERTLATSFGGLIGESARVVKAKSIARLPARAPTCVIALSRSEVGALDLKDDAQLTAENCAIFSNSTSSNGLRISHRASMSASFICSSGGKGGSLSQFRPRPLTDCPPVDDPLSARPAPDASGHCLFTNKVVGKGTTVLLPGTYCGGLTIRDNADVTLRSGTYLIKDGPLTVTGGAKVVGDGITFYFDGDLATLALESNSTVSLSAPKTGAMAGLLMFEARGASEGRKFRISSDNTRVLLGTIYLPKGSLFVDAQKEVADKSAFTVIVARTIKLEHGPNLVLNTDYLSTDVPVPAGLGPASDPAYLAN